MEIDLRKQNWLICSNKQNISKHIEVLIKSIDFFSFNYENFPLIGDLNAIWECCFKRFLQST